MRLTLTSLLFTILVATVAAEEAPARRWGERELTPSVLRKVYKWLPREDQERLRDEPIEKVKKFLEKKQEDSPWRMPWSRKDLIKEDNADALLEIFDDKGDDEQKRLTTTVPFVDAIRALKIAASENSGEAQPTMRIEVDNPEVRNPGTRNARVTLRGTTTGVPDKLGIRVTAELRYPERDSLPVLARSLAMVNKNKFKLDLQLPRKTLLHGKYWVRVELDFGKVRRKQEVMINGEMPVVSATRMCLVGVDEEYPNKPDQAPVVIEQDIGIKLWHLALIEYEPIEIGSDQHPADDPLALHWDAINRRLQTLWNEHRAAGAAPALELRDLVTARADEMKEYFDPVIWRDVLDNQVYPMLDAAETLLRERRDSVLRERFPEYYRHFLDRTGILPMVAEYAALRSAELYQAAGQEVPAEDQKYLRTPGRKAPDCLNLIQHNLNQIYNRRTGISVEAVTDLLVKLEELGVRR